MFVFLHVAWNNQNQTNVFCVLTCRMHDFLEEMCVAGGTVFVLLCTSPDVASLKGGRVMCEGKFFWHVGTKDVLRVLFQTNLKPNDSDVKHCSLVKHSFLFAKHGVREAQILM